jgi:uncharacterized protein DUF6988
MPRQRERDRTANYSFRINYLRSYSIRGTGRSPGQVANSQYSAGMTFTESLGIADATNREMWETIYRAPFDGSIVTHKTLYLIGLIDLALEHQAAINLLIRQKHPGSAMALVRSVIEAMYKGAWVIAKASERDAEKIRQDKFDFPGTGTMVSEADAAFQTGGFFAEAKKGNWKTLNSFTHSGGMQLGRRFTQNDLAINYPDHELQYAVTSTLTAIGVLALPFLASVGRTDDVQKLTAILERISTWPQ